MSPSPLHRALTYGLPTSGAVLIGCLTPACCLAIEATSQYPPECLSLTLLPLFCSHLLCFSPLHFYTFILFAILFSYSAYWLTTIVLFMHCMSRVIIDCLHLSYEPRTCSFFSFYTYYYVFYSLQRDLWYIFSHSYSHFLLSLLQPLYIVACWKIYSMPMLEFITDSQRLTLLSVAVGIYT